MVWSHPVTLRLAVPAPCRPVSRAGRMKKTSNPAASGALEEPSTSVHSGLESWRWGDGRSCVDQWVELPFSPLGAPPW